MNLVRWLNRHVTFGRLACFIAVLSLLALAGGAWIGVLTKEGYLP